MNASKKGRAAHALDAELAQLAMHSGPTTDFHLRQYPEAHLLAAQARAEFIRRGDRPGRYFVHLGRRFEFEASPDRRLSVMAVPSGQVLLTVPLG